MKKILIVDDEIDILEPLSLLLKLEGYDVDTISKGEQTYKKVETFKPNLILLDILMSGADGRVICSTLKKNRKTKKIPIIIMSAHPSIELDSIKSGANDFIAKPFEMEDLFKAVKHNIS